MPGDLGSRSMVKVAVPDVEEGQSSAPGFAPIAADGLRRELNLFGAVSMIVGIVIGSGIFLGINRVAAGTGSPSLIVAVWVIGGFLTLMGALTYAELGVLFPRAGGEYVFLKEGLGSLLAFLSGWTAFTINLAGSAAALAVIFAEQLNVLKPEGWAAWISPSFSVKLTAASLILLLAIVNYFGIKFGGNVQKAFTVLKGLLIVILAGAAMLYLGDASSPEVGFFESADYSYKQDAGTPDETVVRGDGFSLSGFLGLSMVAALFAYDGWSNVVRVGSEIREPGRNLPKAMLFGLGTVMLLYILVSFGYLNVLGYQGFADGTYAGFDSARTVASNTAQVLFGPGGQGLVAAMILVSVFGSLNGITIAGPRIYYAMSRDRLFPRLFSAVNRHHVPGRAIFAQAGLGVGFLFFFDFEELTDNVVFISFMFYALAAICLLVLRRTHPEMPRPYKVPGYPVVPIIFIVTSLAFVGYLLYDQLSTLSLGNLNRLAGLGVVAAGIPVYLFYRARLVKEARALGLPPPEPMFGPKR